MIMRYGDGNSFVIILILYFVSCTWADNSIDSWKYSPPQCDRIKAQEDLALDKIMGKWYVVEILEHKPMPKDVDTKVVVDTCPIIRIRQDDRAELLRLVWTEQKGELEYTFRVPLPNILGYWITAGLQNGSLSEKHYTQFVGSVHVIKAVAQHMVLTFCSSGPDYKLYSVLLGRDYKLDKISIAGVHNLLKRRTPNISGIKSTCTRGDANLIKYNLPLIFIIIVYHLPIYN